jgi:hypothetical protein
MSDGTVRVTSPAGRSVYVDGNYDDPDPPTIPDVILVPLKQCIFETLDAQNRVDYRGTATPTPDKPNVRLALSPVNPPEPV